MSADQSQSAERQKNLAITLGIALAVLAVEVVGGILSGSLALLSDAAHVFADTGGIALSLFAVWMARRRATPLRTYGYYRVEILAALLNGAILLALSVFILSEAVLRWQNPTGVEGGLMMGVAAFGLVANLAGAFVLFKNSQESLNVKAAFNEVASDALGGVGALVAGLIIYLTGYLRADAIVSGLIALLIIPRTVGIMRQAVDILLESTPSHINLLDVQAALMALPGIIKAHDLHVWTITSGRYALSAHLVLAEDADWVAARELVTRSESILREQFDIRHTTIELESQTEADAEHMDD